VHDVPAGAGVTPTQLALWQVLVSQHTLPMLHVDPSFAHAVQLISAETVSGQPVVFSPSDTVSVIVGVPSAVHV
jgi:hypothetical protein